MPTINEKMQPKTKVSYRKWQIDPMGDYGYGQCPYCGQAGDSDGEDTNGDGTSSEYFTCDDCGITYSYQTTIAHRFEGIEND